MDATLSGPVATLQHLKHDKGFTEDDLVRATGASARSIRRWLGEGAQPIRGGYDDRIDDLRAVMEILTAAYSAETARDWLKARNRDLDYNRPLDLLAEGQFDAVRQAAEAFVEGDHR